MKLFLHTLLFCLVSFSITSCDDDDDTGIIEPEPPMTTVCEKQVTFLLDNVEACATGTYTLGTGTSTALNLAVDGGATLSIAVLGGAIQTIAIPSGNATYTDTDGTIFTSTSGGILDVTDNVTTLDATFNFDAANANGDAVSITAGVIVDLPQ